MDKPTKILVFCRYQCQFWSCRSIPLLWISPGLMSQGYHTNTICQIRLGHFMPTTGNCSYDDVNVAVMKEACARQNRCMLPLQFPAYSYRTYVIAASVLALALGVLVAYGMPQQKASHAGTVGIAQQIEKGVVYPSTSSKAPALIPAPVRAPMKELHIANNGLVLLRGARVLDISGDSMRVAIPWSSGMLSWTVNIEGRTQFLTADGEKGARADIQTGDTVTVSGMLDAGGTNPSIVAQYVRE